MDKWLFFTALAAAYAEVGEFEIAVAFQQKALKLATDAQREVWRWLEEEYRAHRPYHEQPVRPNLPLDNGREGSPLVGQVFGIRCVPRTVPHA